MRTHAARLLVLVALVVLWPRGVAAQEVLTPLQVAEAMRACLPITRIVEAEGHLAPTARVNVDGAPSFEARNGDGSTTTVDAGYFWLERSDGTSGTYTVHPHVRDGLVLLIFPRYPGASISDMDGARIRAFRDRVLGCYDSSSGLTPAEVDVVLRYDDLFYAPSRPESLPLGAFPKAILVPSRRGTLFDGLDLHDAVVWRSADGNVQYDVRLRGHDADRPEPTSAHFRGSLGRAEYDLTAANLCGSSGTYRASPGPGGARLVSEVFCDLAVGGRPSVVYHATCCVAAPMWTVDWYDPAEDVSYSAGLWLDAEGRVGGTDIGPENVVYARRLVDAATGLVRVQADAFRDRQLPRHPR